MKFPKDFLNKKILIFGYGKTGKSAGKLLDKFKINYSIYDDNISKKKKLFDKEFYKNNYDFIIIDCSPSLGIVTVNALVASDSVIIPVQCEYFALEGLGKLLETIKLIQRDLNKNLNIEGILMSMYDVRLRLSNQVVEEVQTHFKNLVFNTIIPRNVKLSEAPSFGVPAISYDASCKGSISYLNLAKEVIDNNNSVKITW